MSKQGTERASLPIPICADDQEFAFGEAFRLQSGLGPTAAIGGHGVLRDDAFQCHVATRGKQRLAAAIKFVADLSAANSIIPDETLQESAAVAEHLLADISAI